MNSTIKTILLIVGIALIAYGVFRVVSPETQLTVGDTNIFTAQNNNDAFIIIGLGVLASAVALILGKKKS